MKNCYQFKNQNMIEHGLLVRKHYKQIIEDLSSKRTDRYDLPDEIVFNRQIILSNQYNSHIMSYYQIYHDCGKARCLVIDDDGRRRYPNHDTVSARAFLQAFKKTKHKRIIADLIASDMVFHAENMTNIQAFLEACDDEKMYWSLLLTSYAELYANKSMFDDANQTSFKIKYKKLKQVTKRILHEHIRRATERIKQSETIHVQANRC